MTQRIGEPVSEWSTRSQRVWAKRIYDTPDPTDGHRVLATQYWPRGVARVSVNEYARILGPSRSLLHAFKNGDVGWAEFSERYLDEMGGEAQQAEIHRLAKLSRSETLTVMCVCPDESICHRSLLRQLIIAFDGET